MLFRSPYDPAIPLLGIYPKKTIIQKDTCTAVFNAALFTTVKTWKQPKCPSTDEWIKKMWYIYIYSGILLSHKKEWNHTICSNIDGSRNCHTKWSMSDRERQILYDIMYMWNLMIWMNLFTKQKQTHRLQKQTYGYQRRKVGERDKLGDWD